MYDRLRRSFACGQWETFMRGTSDPASPSSGHIFKVLRYTNWDWRFLTSLLLNASASACRVSADLSWIVQCQGYVINIDASLSFLYTFLVNKIVSFLPNIAPDLLPFEPCHCLYEESVWLFRLLLAWRIVRIGLPETQRHSSRNLGAHHKNVEQNLRKTKEVRYVQF